MPKYKLGQKLERGHGLSTLYRVIASEDFIAGNGTLIKAGTMGGYIESEQNLSQEGAAWVDSDAKVCGNARVYESAFVAEGALVQGNAEVFGSACVGIKSHISGNTKIYENANINGAFSTGDVRLHGNILLIGSFALNANAEICGEAYLDGSGFIGRDAYITKITDFFNATPMPIDGLIGALMQISCYRTKDDNMGIGIGDIVSFPRYEYFLKLLSIDGTQDYEDLCELLNFAHRRIFGKC